MAIEFRCVQCNKLLRTGDETAGKQAKCPECGAVMTIPAAAEGEAQGLSPPSLPLAGGGSDLGAGSPFARAPAGETSYQSPTQSAPHVGNVNGSRSGRDAMAVISLILGILGFPTMCCLPLAFTTEIGGIILGSLGLRSQYRTVAIIGIVLCSLQLVAVVAMAVFYAYMVATGQK